jgi:hypothetical protein
METPTQANVPGAALPATNVPAGAVPPAVPAQTGQTVANNTAPVQSTITGLNGQTVTQDQISKAYAAGTTEQKAAWDAKTGTTGGQLKQGATTVTQQPAPQPGVTVTVAPVEPAKPVVNPNGQEIPQGFTSFDTSAGKNLSQPGTAQNATETAQGSTTAAGAAPTQPKTPKEVADAIFAKNPNLKSTDFQKEINSSGIAGTPEEMKVWDAYHEYTHSQLGLNKYGASDVNSLASAISNGDLAVGSPTWNAVSAMNPNAAAAKAKYEADLRAKSANELASKLVTGNGGKSVSSSTTSGTTLENLSEKITSKVTDPNQIYSLADALAKIPEVGQFKSKVLAGDATIDELTRAKMKNYEDLKKQYPNVPASVLMGMEAKMDKDLDEQIYNAQRDRNYNAGMLTYYADIAKSQVESYNTIAAEQRKVAQSKELATFEAGLKPNTMAIGNDLYQYDQATGKWSLAVSGTGKVALQQIKRTNPLTGMEETVGSFDPSTGVSSFYDGTTSGGASGAGYSGTTGGFSATGSASTGGTLADRNNNPGNLRDPKTGEFRQFATAEEGFAAMEQDLTAKLTGNSPATRAKLGRNAQTLQDVISVYAPVGDNNDPVAYAAAVAKDMGISPNEPVANLVPRLQELTRAMAKHEGWTGGASAQSSQGGQPSQSTIDPQTVIASITQGDAKKFASTNAQYQNVLSRNGQKAASEWLIKQAVNADADTKKKFEVAQKEVGDASSLLTMLDQANYNPGIVANKLLDLKAWSGIGITDDDKQAMAVRAALIANQSKKRNDLFGASLTTNEGNSANQFLALSPGETIESIKAKLKGQQAMAQIAQDNIKMRAIGVPEETIQQNEKEAITALMGSFKTQGATTEGSDKEAAAAIAAIKAPTEPKKPVTEAQKKIADAKVAQESKYDRTWTNEQSQNVQSNADDAYDGIFDLKMEDATAAFKEMKPGTWYKLDDGTFFQKQRGGGAIVHKPGSYFSAFEEIKGDYYKGRKIN